MKHISTDELRKMTDTEGLILQGCGGDPEDWVLGINVMLTEKGILLNGDTFTDISVFEHDGTTNMLFGMEDVKLDIGKLAMWRLASHDTFGGTWLSDYLPNQLNIHMDVAISERVGHESIEITLRYAHLFPSKQIEMADRLNIEMEVPVS